MYTYIRTYVHIHVHNAYIPTYVHTYVHTYHINYIHLNCSVSFLASRTLLRVVFASEAARKSVSNERVSSCVLPNNTLCGGDTCHMYPCGWGTCHTPNNTLWGGGNIPCGWGPLTIPCGWGPLTIPCGWQYPVGGDP